MVLSKLDDRGGDNKAREKGRYQRCSRHFGLSDPRTEPPFAKMRKTKEGASVIPGKDLSGHIGQVRG